jgi:hypothetical protein
VKALAQSLHEPDTDALSPKEIRSQLSAAGVNMENVKKRVSTLLAQAEGRAALARAGTQRRTSLTRMVALRHRISETGDLRERSEANVSQNLVIRLRRRSLPEQAAVRAMNGLVRTKARIPERRRMGLEARGSRAVERRFARTCLPISGRPGLHRTDR